MPAGLLQLFVFSLRNKKELSSDFLISKLRNGFQLAGVGQWCAFHRCAAGVSGELEEQLCPEFPSQDGAGPRFTSGWSQSARPLCVRLHALGHVGGHRRGCTEQLVQEQK